MKEYSTCMNCRDSYQIDLNLPDALWDKIVAKQTPDVEIKLCPMCIGYLIHKFSKSENVSGAFKFIDLVNSHSNTKDGQLVSEAMDVLRYCKTHFDLFTPHDESVLEEMIVRLESHAAELDRVREYEINFDGHVKAKLTVKNNEIKVEAAMNGYGDGIRLDRIYTNQLTKEDNDGR